MKQCTNCGSTLEPDEEEASRKDENGKIVCDQCFDDKYQHLCPICEEYFWEDYNKKISPTHLIVTKQAEENHVSKAGFYEIVSLPFYADGIIEAHLFESAVNKLSDLPTDFDDSDLHYPLYFICESCAEKMLKNNHPRAT